MMNENLVLDELEDISLENAPSNSSQPLERPMSPTQMAALESFKKYYAAPNLSERARFFLDAICSTLTSQVQDDLSKFVIDNTYDWASAILKLSKEYLTLAATQTPCANPDIIKDFLQQLTVEALCKLASRLRSNDPYSLDSRKNQQKTAIKQYTEFLFINALSCQTLIDLLTQKHPQDGSFIYGTSISLHSSHFKFILLLKLLHLHKNDKVNFIKTTLCDKDKLGKTLFEYIFQDKVYVITLLTTDFEKLPYHDQIDPQFIYTTKNKNTSVYLMKVELLFLLFEPTDSLWQTLVTPPLFTKVVQFLNAYNNASDKQSYKIPKAVYLSLASKIIASCEHQLSTFIKQHPYSFTYLVNNELLYNLVLKNKTDEEIDRFIAETLPNNEKSPYVIDMLFENACAPNVARVIQSLSAQTLNAAFAQQYTRNRISAFAEIAERSTSQHILANLDLAHILNRFVPAKKASPLAKINDPKVLNCRYVMMVRVFLHQVKGCLDNPQDQTQKTILRELISVETNPNSLFHGYLAFFGPLKAKEFFIFLSKILNTRLALSTATLQEKQLYQAALPEIDKRISALDKSIFAFKAVADTVKEYNYSGLLPSLFKNQIIKASKTSKFCADFGLCGDDLFRILVKRNYKDVQNTRLHNSSLTYEQRIDLLTFLNESAPLLLDDVLWTKNEEKKSVFDCLLTAYYLEFAEADSAVKSYEMDVISHTPIAISPTELTADKDPFLALLTRKDINESLKTTLRLAYCAQKNTSFFTLDIPTIYQFKRKYLLPKDALNRSIHDAPEDFLLYLLDAYHNCIADQDTLPTMKLFFSLISSQGLIDLLHAKDVFVLRDEPNLIDPQLKVMFILKAKEIIPAQKLNQFLLSATSGKTVLQHLMSLKKIFLFPNNWGAGSEYHSLKGLILSLLMQLPNHSILKELNNTTIPTILNYLLNTQARWNDFPQLQDLAEKFMTHINSAPFIEYFRAYPGAILMLIQSPKLYPLFKKIDDATLDKLLFQHPAHNRLYHYRLANLLIENVGIPQACEILMRFSAKPLSLAFSAYNFVPKGNIAYAAQTSSGPLPMLDVYQTINICYNRLFFLSCCCPDVLTFGHLLSTLELSSIQTDIARPYPIINDNYTKNTLVSVADANYGLFSYFYLLSCYFTAVTEKHEDYINQIKYSLWALLHDEKPTYTIQRATMPSLDEGLSIFIGNKYLQDILRNVLSNRLKNPLTSQEEKNLLHLIMADPVPSEDIFCDNGCVELDIFRA